MSEQPSPAAPSDVRSEVPSFSNAFVDEAGFRSLLLTSQRDVFNETEEALIALLYESYTDDFAPPDATRVTTQCLVQRQEVFDCSASNPFCTDWGVNISDPNSQEGYINFIDFFCNYTSSVTDVTGFPDLFVTFTDNNGDLITNEMQALDLPVLRAFAASFLITPSPTSSPIQAPSVSPYPTRSPIEVPSVSPRPTRSLQEPSVSPRPTYRRTTGAPTVSPSYTPNTNTPMIVNLPATTVPTTDDPTLPSGGVQQNPSGGVAFLLASLFLWHLF